jgi:phosphocarrier protein HPr
VSFNSSLLSHHSSLSMINRLIIIPNRLGLHARAAAKLVRLANSYESSVQISRCDSPEKIVDAKSILGILMLAATQQTEIELKVNGSDEAEALEALCQLIQNKFGEPE